jgi:DNA-binding NtrC family response regulator
VLLAEDEEGVRQLIATVLEQNGYRVVVANDGEQAMREFERSRDPIDLLISDVVMPGMRGTELAGRLREIQPDLHVLFISGYTDPAISTEVVSRRSQFLQKPFSSEALLRAVKDAVRR